MAFRTLIIDKATKVNLDLNNIVVHYEDKPYWINLDDISIIIIEDPRCLVSLRLLTEIIEKGITMVFCDTSHQPIGTIQTLYNNVREPKKIKMQIKWGIKEHEYH